jgi:DNA-3-methyladenine glycosylase II
VTTAKLRLEGPLDLATTLDVLGRWGDDGIDRFDGRLLARTVPVEGRRVAFIAEPSGTIHDPALRITLEAGAPDGVLEAIAASFTTAPPDFVRLRGEDPLVRRLDRRWPGLRTVLHPDLLLALVRAISAQQVNLRWASTTRRRLAEAFGTRHHVDGHVVFGLDAERLAELAPAELRALQFTTRKSEYIVGAARAVARGDVSFDRLRVLDDGGVIGSLIELRGIGLWTAEWILVRSLGRPRVVAGDLGVRKAVGLAYLGSPIADEAEVRAATMHWRESATVAQQLLLQGLDSGDFDPPSN